MEPIKSLNLDYPPDPAPSLQQGGKYPVPFINLHETLKFDTQCLNRVVDMILALVGPSVLPFEFSGEQEKKVQTSAAQKANAHDPIYPLQPIMGRALQEVEHMHGSGPIYVNGHLVSIRNGPCYYKCKYKYRKYVYKPTALPILESNKSCKMTNGIESLEILSRFFLICKTLLSIL
jgi:hypothetical protein